MRLLLATSNPGKIKKLREKLADLPIQIVTAEELGFASLDVDETGATFEENARLKAKAYWDAAQEHGVTDVAVLADDGGVEIDALNGEPGVRSHRWAGEGAGDEGIIRHTLKRLEGVPMEKRTARFRVVQILMMPDGSEVVSEGRTEGRISDTYRTNRIPGLPYAGLLIVDSCGKLLDDLTPEEEAHTHRAKSLAALRRELLGVI